jgi:heptosyltransferase-2/heptosyltransferase-3
VLHGITGEGETVVVTGGPDEAPLARAVAAFVNRPILDLTGRTGLGELAAVFARCRLVLGPDSGPLHLAVAVGVPTVHLFGPASQHRFGPWGPPGKHMVVSTALPCAPCGRLNWPEPAEHPCVRTISPEAVLEAARSCERPAANL